MTFRYMLCVCVCVCVFFFFFNGEEMFTPFQLQAGETSLSALFAKCSI